MDKLIYTAMTGAKATLSQQASVANNLANVSTTGFRAELHRLRAVPVQSEAQPTRAFVVDASVGNDFSSGPLQKTGNSLDVAVSGKGWLTVSLPDGSEAYTRAGSLTVDENGGLRTQGGYEVMGQDGPLTVPPDNAIEFAADGSVTATPLTGARNTANVVGRLKLVNPDEAEMVRGADGLFRQRSGEPADADEAVRVAGGYLEGSNVNLVEQMVAMVANSRNYEMHTRMLQAAQDNDKAATQVLASS